MMNTGKSASPSRVENQYLESGTDEFGANAAGSRTFDV